MSFFPTDDIVIWLRGRSTRRIAESSGRDVLSSALVQRGFINDHCPVCVAAVDVIDLGISEPAPLYNRSSVVVVQETTQTRRRRTTTDRLYNL